MRYIGGHLLQPVNKGHSASMYYVAHRSVYDTDLYFREETMNKNRPKHLALHHIKFPLPAIVSGLHRISGLMLFLSLPLLLWILQYSLRSIETFTMLDGMLQHPISKLFLMVVLWAFLHHFCAGIRYLAIDLDYGVKLAQARTNSKWVVMISLTLTILIGARLW